MTQDTSDTLNTESPLNTDIHEDSAQGDSSGTQDETEQLKAEIANLREYTRMRYYSPLSRMF